MDDIVLRGMAKWPNVPAVYGWLALDRRGNWLIKGERIANPGVIAFIGRNYGRDGEGRWFFQNGPQRVFVTLEYTPVVYRIMNSTDEPLAIETHTGEPVTDINGAWADETGAFLLRTEHGIGTVHDGDLDRLVPSLVDVDGSPLDETALDERMEALEHGDRAPVALRHRNGRVTVEPVKSNEVPRRFGYVAIPVAPAGKETCP